MELLFELERNPRRRFLSFLTGLGCNLCLLGGLCVVRFEAPDLFVRPNLTKAVVIAPRRLLPLAKIPRVLHIASLSPRLWAPPVRTQQTTPLALPQPVAVAPSSLPPEASHFEVPPVAHIEPPRAPVIPPKTGLFVLAETMSRVPKASAGTAMQVDSFAAATAASANIRTSRGVETTGFGTAAASSRSGSAIGAQAAGISGFDTPQLLVAKPPRDIVVTPTGAFSSAEILSKPKPDYTEEARTRRVQGEVWLEVLFGADGTPRVRQVLRSLGYGLDENAIRAARQIRFRPAREGTREVDQVATVRVQFQLAE